MRFWTWPRGIRTSNVNDLKWLTATPVNKPTDQTLDALPLFSGIPHIPPKRSALWSAEQAYSRTLRARAWRKIRRDVEAMEPDSRRDFWPCWRSPAGTQFYEGTPEGARKFYEAIISQ